MIVHVGEGLWLGCGLRRTDSTLGMGCSARASSKGTFPPPTTWVLIYCYYNHIILHKLSKGKMVQLA